MMDLDLSQFRIVESVGWTVFFCCLILFYGHFFTFLGLCFFIRKGYMMLKRSKLGLLETKGKSVLITGCDTGFGLGLAKHLWEKGFTVLATCLTPDRDGGRTLSEINSDRLRVLPMDVSSDQSVARCLQVVQEQCASRGLWGLVNNAGINFIGDVELTTMEQYLTQGNVNLYGTVRTCKAFLPLIRQARGRIVNVTSVKGFLAVPGCAAYTITKYGGEAFAETLRIEQEQFGIKVSVIEPSNFGGITGCLSEQGLQRIQRDLDDMWNTASKDIKQFYGKAHIEQTVENAAKCASTTCPTIDPVLNAFEDALRNPCPMTRYCVPGSNSYFDTFYMTGLVQPYLPQKLFDKLRTYFFPYIVYK